MQSDENNSRVFSLFFRNRVSTETNSQLFNRIGHKVRAAIKFSFWKHILRSDLANQRVYGQFALLHGNLDTQKWKRCVSSNMCQSRVCSLQRNRIESAQCDQSLCALPFGLSNQTQLSSGASIQFLMHFLWGKHLVFSSRVACFSEKVVHLICAMALNVCSTVNFTPK